LRFLLERKKREKLVKTNGVEITSRLTDGNWAATGKKKKSPSGGEGSLASITTSGIASEVLFEKRKEICDRVERNLKGVPYEKRKKFGGGGGDAARQKMREDVLPCGIIGRAYAAGKKKRREGLSAYYGVRDYKRIDNGEGGEKDSFMGNRF